MLLEQGYVTARDRGVQLWIMFAELHERMRAVALEIDYTENLNSGSRPMRVYRTLKIDGLEGYAGPCPTCEAPIRATDDLQLIEGCPHFVRMWRVAGDGRVRAEFRTEPAHA